ncbi:MAG: dTDP-glucose 4,6-dehydratase [Planctomycetota bacterium]|nr:MAG: dTDP-glucose 4,6-dehydratase [Planctomycetota bacterium]
MRVFVAGASGAIGRPLVARLLMAGHQVVAMTRSPRAAAQLAEMGAQPVVCDAFELPALARALREARPEAVVHQLTAIPSRVHPRRVAAQLAATNRLRTEGTRNLLQAARAAGARRLLVQSVAFAYAPRRGGPHTEQEPLYLQAPRAFRPVIAAVDELERLATGSPGLTGIVLRYGLFYGPGTIYAPDGSFAADVRRRRVPLIGGGEGVFSFIQLEDAAAATVQALERAAPGIYNVVDDDPAPMRSWLPHYAELLGAPPPRRLPRWLGRLAGGPYAIYLCCEQRGASNARARAALGWAPRHPSWREGFATLLGRPAAGCGCSAHRVAGTR